MAKIKRFETEDCPYKLCPLGAGLPLCAYNLMKEGKLGEAKLQDFPPCSRKNCPKDISS